MCSIIIVKCSWDGLPEGRNCSCVWSFWCSQLCSIDQNSSKRECSGCEGSRDDVRGPEMIWGVQRWCEGSRDGVRGPEMMWGSRDGVRGPEMVWGAFFTMESMEVSHFRSWEMLVPRNLTDSTAVTELFMMVSGVRAGGLSGVRAGGVLLKSTVISTVLSVLSSRLSRLHQTASSLTSIKLTQLWINYLFKTAGWTLFPFVCLLSCFCCVGFTFFKTSPPFTVLISRWNRIACMLFLNAEGIFFDVFKSMYLSFLQNWSDSLLIQNSCERNKRSQSFLYIGL